ncbi:SDR family NAD(P)-dependent oxidoreductase [Luteimonas sp. RD2P54]|uniref:SDR family NAD(P)-dependent oxidoreductase n=1 Tax=Luteimonas endophytica TaxID=3042023 RepID=A0ABT6JAH9_9GAMM|nr:SDR family NAD(P)-dependent oxidoreductase [Luteimonas endophytica]MDH5823833.1 SDR family NAD(P)-dependent oxidoreductase [Luteimonas endophytica]
MSAATFPGVAGQAPGAAPLDGRVVLVAGAHGGLGQAASLACARAGARLVLLGRRIPKLNRLLDAIEREGGEAVLYPLDLEGAGPDDYAELARRIESGYGRLDGLMHCAAEFRGLTPLEHTDPAAFARAIHVGLTARWWLTQACLPLLRRGADASVVFVVDAADATSGAYWGGYGIAQSGLHAMVRMLHAELAGTAVRISGLQPGPMRTPLLARAYVEGDRAGACEPERYAGACVTLLSAAGAARRGQIWRPGPDVGGIALPMLAAQ